MAKNETSMWISIPVGDDIKTKAIFTTRNGGVSDFPYDTLNLSFQRSDRKENVIKNFEILAKNIGIPMDYMVLASQVHGSKITVVDKNHGGMGITKKRDFGDTDGLVTADTNVALITFHADCVPIYLFDSSKKVIGLVHSGWRSTLQNISAKAVGVMKDKFNCKSSDINAVIGPCIRKCCFEVGKEVYESFANVFPDYTKAFKRCGDKWNIDLTYIITNTLLCEGLNLSNISDVKMCTVCKKELFFSHRGGHGISGTGAALFMMIE